MRLLQAPLVAGTPTMKRQEPEALRRAQHNTSILNIDKALQARKLETVWIVF